MSFMTENLSNQIPTVLAMLGIICIIGSCGNLLVIIVYGLKQDRLTSTVFILILAISDFLSCLILIPGTMLIEYLEWKFDSTFLCKFYYFNNNTFIPFSSLLITCIAFDRYFCLCHPFKKIMTRSRARRVIGILILICIFLGFCSTFTVRVAKADPYEQSQQLIIKQPELDSLSNFDHVRIGNLTETNPDPDDQFKMKHSQEQDMTPKMDMFECTEIVKLNSSALERAIYQIVQKSQTVSYIMCILSVIVLYILIYRSVSKVFKKRLELKGGLLRSNAPEKSVENCALKNSTIKHNNGSIHSQSKITAFSKRFAKRNDNTQQGNCLKNSPDIEQKPQELYTINEADKFIGVTPDVQISVSDDTNMPTCDITQEANQISPQQENRQSKIKSSFLNIPSWKRHRVSGTRLPTSENKSEISSDNYSQVVEPEPRSCTGIDDRSRKSTKSLRDTIAFQNLKTAAMLFVVAVVYIVTFIPAMLMASNLVPLYLPIFYLYYVNNSINPIIYGFMNPNFRNDIRELLCKKLKCTRT